MPMDIAAQVAAFFGAYPLRTFNKRQIVLGADEPVESVFYLARGRMSQYDITPGGNEVVVNVFKPGAFFPMSAAINGTPNHYFFEASTEAAAHIAPAADAVQFLKDNTDVLFDLLARVYRGTDGVLRRMAHLMGGGAKSRLLFELLNAAYRFGEPQPGGTIFVALKESDLARHSGLARETVNRTIRGLKTEGVEIVRDGIIVADIRRLETLLGNGL